MSEESSKQAKRDGAMARATVQAEPSRGGMMAQRRPLIAPLPTLFWLLFHVFVATAAAAEEEFLIAGYLPDYRHYINLDAAAKHLSDVILFSIQPEPDGSVTGPNVCCLGDGHYAKAVAAQKSDGNLRIFASVGGAGRSQHLASIASDPQRRKILIANLIQLCKKEQLHGIDFDWEQPQTQEDFVSYLHLLFEAGQAFHKAKLLLTVALHPNQRLAPQIYEVVDRIHLMTYDMITSTGPGSHHATLDNTKQAADALVNSGCPKEKIVLGIPAYARHEDNPGMVKTYSEIVDSVAGDSESHDSLVEAMAEIGGRYQGYAFDSTLDVQNKVRYAKEANLKGIFFWEVGQDSFQKDYVMSGALLAAAHREASDSLSNGEEMVGMMEL